MRNIILILNYIIPFFISTKNAFFVDGSLNEKILAYTIFFWLPMFFSYLPYFDYPKEIRLYALSGGSFAATSLLLLFLLKLSQLPSSSGDIGLAFILVGFSCIPIYLLSNTIINKANNDKKKIFVYAFITTFMLNSYIFLFN